MTQASRESDLAPQGHVASVLPQGLGLRDWVRNDTPRPLREVDLLTKLLGPGLEQLLGTTDLELLDARWRNLVVDETADVERADLESDIDAVTRRRPSWWERGRRLAEVVVGAQVLGVVLVWILSMLSSEFGALTRWFDWPPSDGTFANLAMALVAAAMLGAGVTWFHLRDELYTARLGIAAALRRRTRTWPGVPVASPIGRLAQLWTWAGVVLLALGLVPLLAAAHWGEVSFPDVIIALPLTGVGLWWLVLAWRRHRLDRCVRATLFVGRV